MDTVDTSVTPTPVKSDCDTFDPAVCVSQPTPARKPSALEKKQARMRERLDRIAGRSTSPAPIVYVNQIEPTLLKMLTACSESGSETIATLAASLLREMPAVMRYMGQVVTDPASKPEQRMRASTTLFWLTGLVMKFQTKLERYSLKKDDAKARAMAAAARKAKHQAAEASVVLTVAKQRKRIAKTLARAQEEAEMKAAREALEVAVRNAPTKLAELQAKQALVKFKQEQKARKGKQ